MSTKTCGSSYLQSPDALAILVHLVHGVTHQGDEHVEQHDVGEQDIGDEQDVKHLDVLYVIREVQLSHADGQLEQLQGRIVDAVELLGWIFGCIPLHEGDNRYSENKIFIYLKRCIF